MTSPDEDTGRLVITTRWRVAGATLRRDVLASRDCLLRCGAVRGAVVEVDGGLLYVIEGKPARLGTLKTVIAGSRTEALHRVLLEDVGPPLGFRTTWPRTPRLTAAETAWAGMLLDGEPPAGALVALLHWAAARAAENLTDFALLPADGDAFPPARLH
jgi:hypothetical protein